MAYAPFGEQYGYTGPWNYVTFTTGGYDFTVNDGHNQSGTLDDFMFRRYSPGQGRWISPDPAGLAAVDPTNPQTWNRYAYVANNPLSFVDPLGLQQCAPGCGGCTIDGCGSNLSGGGAPGDWCPGCLSFGPGQLLSSRTGGMRVAYLTTSIATRTGTATGRRVCDHRSVQRNILTD